MKDLLDRADPAIGYEVDGDRLRALVDERIGLVPMARPARRRFARRRLVAAAVFAAVLAVAVPALLSSDESASTLPLDVVAELPGVRMVVPLASGGVQTMAVDGDSIWVVTALQNKLQRVSISAGAVDAVYDIDGHVEDVVVGGGHIWLMSYDNGGEVLRFDPASGTVDMRTPLDGLPRFARWFEDSLYVSNDAGELVEVSQEGEIVSVGSGTLVGNGLGHLWVLDPEDGSIRSLAPDGSGSDYVIPADTVLGDLGQVRNVAAAGGFLWLIFGDASDDVGRFDPETGEVEAIHAGRWLHALTAHDGALWVSSHTDGLLLRIDPETRQVRRFVVPGKPGGLASTGDGLFVLLHQPGTLLGLDTTADLIEAGEEVFSTTGSTGHTLTCNQADPELVAAPTVILDGPSWSDPGIWSVIAAQVAGSVVCASGNPDVAVAPEQRAADLESALEVGDIRGPYLLVAAGDGVHTLRLFAEDRDDIAGVVLIEPMPLGFQEFYDTLLGEELAHPPWLDLEAAVSESLADFGGLPVVVVSHHPEAVFLHKRFVESSGLEAARSISDYWERGMDFYAALSTDSRRVVVPDTGFEGVMWFRPDLVVDAIRELADPSQ